MRKNSSFENAIETVVGEINRLLTEKQSAIIAIDGRCAAGKTTFAVALQQKISCNLFHMDHFFLHPEQRTTERFSSPGGNLDYERFIKEVFVPLQKGIPFSYRPYDCHTQSLKPPVAIIPKPVSVMEGAYSCHPSLDSYYDLRLFFDVDFNTQTQRILRRGGKEVLEQFQSSWIPLEEEYLSFFQIERKCDFSFCLSDNLNSHRTFSPGKNKNIG